MMQQTWKMLQINSTVDEWLAFIAEKTGKKKSVIVSEIIEELMHLFCTFESEQTYWLHTDLANRKLIVQVIGKGCNIVMGSGSEDKTDEQIDKELLEKHDVTIPVAPLKVAVEHTESFPVAPLNILVKKDVKLGVKNE
jgi:hypothetical protein